MARRAQGEAAETRAGTSAKARADAQPDTHPQARTAARGKAGTRAKAGAATRRAAPPEGETRRRLIEAGIELFGRHGFEGVSTRALAREAQVNLAAIPYHFGGKEGLYRAVVEFVVQTVSEQLGATLLSVREMARDPRTGRDELLAAVRGMIRSMVHTILGSSVTLDYCRVLMQEQITPTEVYDVLYQGLFQAMHQTWTAVLARLLHAREGSPEVDMRAQAVMGQIVIFRIGMPVTLRYLRTERLHHDHLECIARLVADQVEALARCAQEATLENDA
ncbi:transcriptional regulator, TetR family [Desulfovibrio sp. X2]|uniref:CerR family C-terminal domain-containing protein n=1 Tax=Desulfovibrio sp. X2 TaxID=941449 RepID=UPI000358874F|nr:CerR family C-terminal domain-containing protein [Desulfovibrio sp. X2]EPR43428.1 transcriptional regulator, TetR family [Desulfovibrio sp. X2]